MSTKSKSNLISQSSFHYFKQITDAFNKSFEAASYKPALLNILEMEETFTRTLGLSSDIVCKEMYSFEDKSGNKLVMRPEGTAGAMRMVMNNTELCKNIEKVPVKLSYWGPMYRYERPQAGRMRQFYQIGIERIGGSVVRGDNFDLGDALEGDLEAIQIGVTALSDIFKDHLKPKIYINNLGNRQSLDKYNQELIKYFSSNDKKLSELSFKRIENGNALRILDSKDQGDIELAKAAPPIDDFIDTKHREQFSELLKILQSLGIEYERDRNLVRGLDYYNGTCFEIKLESQDFTKNLDCLGESQNTVLAGGRYDYLAPHFGFNRADGLSSIGFAAGIDRLALVLEYLEQNKQVEASSKESIFGITFVIVISICDLQDKTESADLYPQLRLRCIEIQEKLRRLKPYTKVELDLRENLKLPDKLNYLMNHRGVTTALVVGSKELSTNTVTLKKDGQTKELAIADLRSVFEW